LNGYWPDPRRCARRSPSRSEARELITADDRVKILDFGLSKIVDERSVGGADSPTAQHTEPGL